MTDNNVLKLSKPSTFSDPLTEVLRNGARSLLAQAVEAEVAANSSEATPMERTDEGRQRLVRQSVGTRDHDRHRPGRGAGHGSATARGWAPIASASSALLRLMRGARRASMVLNPLPQGHLHRRLHRGAGGLTRAGRRRPLGLVHRAAHRSLGGGARTWLKRDLSARRYVYSGPRHLTTCGPARTTRNACWSSSARRPRAWKELVGLIDVRESTQSWRELLLEIRGAGSRWGLNSRSPTARSASGKGDRGSVVPDARPALLGAQDANVLNKLPKSQNRRQSVLSRNLDGRDQERRRQRLRHLHWTYPSNDEKDA